MESSPTTPRAPISVIHRLSTFSGAVAGVIVLVLTIQIAADVLSRNVFNQPIPGTLELTANLFMPLIVFLSLAYAEYAGEHIRATIIVGSLTGRTALATELIGRIVTLLVVLALTYYAVIGAIYATELRLEVLGAITLPVWPVRILAAVGLMLFAIQLTASIVIVGAQSTQRKVHD